MQWGQKKERPRADSPGQTSHLCPSIGTTYIAVTTRAASRLCSSTKKTSCRANQKNQAQSTPLPKGKANLGELLQPEQKPRVPHLRGAHAAPGPSTSPTALR